MTNPIGKEHFNGRSVPQPVIDSVLQSWASSERKTLFETQGSSMWPYVSPGDRLLIVYGWSGVRPGALVAYQQNGKLIVHRLLRFVKHEGEKKLLIKGDNCPLPDPIVASQQVVGWVYAVQRGEKIYPINTPGWRFISQVIVMLARLSLGLEDRARQVKRTWFKNVQVGFFSRVYRITLRVFSLPGPYLSRLVWKIMH